MDRCRLCGSSFCPEPIVRYDDMPRAAQGMPDAASLHQDAGIDMEVRQCSACGLVQLTNEPVPYFREVIRAAAFSEEMRAFRLEQFRDFVERYSLQGKKIVEIGCGRGEYLSLMRQCGPDVYGLEQSPDSVGQCRENGLPVTQGFIENAEYRIANGPFDAFFILNFLEHLPSPGAVLRGICANLADGGIGLVEVPNFDMILRKGLFSEFIVDHLCYFTRETLETAARLNGFSVLHCGEVWHDYILSMVVQKRPPAVAEGFRAGLERIGGELDAYLRRFGEGETAVWGAGHQAFTLLALFGLGKRIRYIIDSAPFKQGRFSPVTHIPIVAPSALDGEPVRAIIVMAASYSDEVASIIKRKYRDRINVAIVRDTGLEIV